ncbi:MAG: CHRD domain-containing protein, partial [Stellaceae bacterium]
MRHLRLIILAMGACVMVSAAGQAATRTFKATLNGASEVPPTTSAGTGTATATLNTATRRLSWDVTYSGLSGPAKAAHIHGPAAPGKNAPVV